MSACFRWLWEGLGAKPWRIGECLSPVGLESSRSYVESDCRPCGIPSFDLWRAGLSRPQNQHERCETTRAQGPRLRAAAARKDESVSIRMLRMIVILTEAS